jgi:hypothetical protein
MLANSPERSTSLMHDLLGPIRGVLRLAEIEVKVPFYVTVVIVKDLTVRELSFEAVLIGERVRPLVTKRCCGSRGAYSIENLSSVGLVSRKRGDAFTN